MTWMSNGWDLTRRCHRQYVAPAAFVAPTYTTLYEGTETVYVQWGVGAVMGVCMYTTVHPVYRYGVGLSPYAR